MGASQIHLALHVHLCVCLRAYMVKKECIKSKGISGIKCQIYELGLCWEEKGKTSPTTAHGRSFSSAAILIRWTKRWNIASKEATNQVLVISKKGPQKHSICQRKSCMIYNNVQRMKVSWRKNEWKISLNYIVVPFCPTDNESILPILNYYRFFPIMEVRADKVWYFKKT